MQKNYLLLIIIVSFIFLFKTTNSQTHFTPVGNFTNAMNINLVQAKVNGINFVAGDEIGIFDGGICVGAAVLTSDLGELIDAKNFGAAAVDISVKLTPRIRS